MDSNELVLPACRVVKLRQYACIEALPIEMTLFKSVRAVTRKIGGREREVPKVGAEVGAIYEYGCLYGHRENLPKQQKKGGLFGPQCPMVGKVRMCGNFCCR